MKQCPICGAGVIVTVHAAAKQDWEGKWHLADALTQDDFDSMCENPVNECICPNQMCGHAYVYSDNTKLILVKVIHYDPSIGMVTDNQFKDYYYSVVDPRNPGNIPLNDERYEYWKHNCVSFMPWSGCVMEAVDA